MDRSSLPAAPARPTLASVFVSALSACLACVGSAAALVAVLAHQVVARGRYPVFDSAPWRLLAQWGGAAAKAALPWAVGLGVVALGLGLFLRLRPVGRTTRWLVLAAPSLAGLLLVAWASDRLRHEVADDRPETGFLPAVRPYVAAPTEPGHVAARPDIVLVTIDTLRADHLGHLGYGRDTSPIIDRLAARGVSYRRAVAPAPMTQPSVASMMTGQPVHAIQAGLFDRRKVRGGAYVRQGFELLAERLLAVGYETAGFVANAHLKRSNGFGQGFATYDDVSGMFGRSPAMRRRHAGHIVDAALEWLRSDASDARPIFLWLHVLDPHDPYEPVEPGPWEDVDSQAFRSFREEYESWTLPEHAQHLRAIKSGSLPLREGELDYLVGRYDAEILQVDRHLGRFLDGWRAAGRDLENSLVVITSDHGEELYDHGGFLHAHTLFDELIHVPLVISGPGFRGGRTPDGQVSLLDVAPTLLRTAGVRLGPGSALAGKPLQDAAPARGTGPALSFLQRRKVALRTAEHKLVGQLRIVEPGCPSGEPWSDLERLYRARYVADRDWPAQDTADKVFDLAADPGETTTVDDPWQHHQMLCAHAEALRRLPPLDAAAGTETGLSDEDKESLRALGYVVD